MRLKKLYEAPETEVLKLAFEDSVLTVTSPGGTNENFGEDAGEGW